MHAYMLFISVLLYLSFLFVKTKGYGVLWIFLLLERGGSAGGAGVPSWLQPIDPSHAPTPPPLLGSPGIMLRAIKFVSF
jgi:hypothetical protein